MIYTDPRTGISVGGTHPVAQSLAKALRDDCEATKNDLPPWCKHAWRDQRTLNWYAIDTDGQRWVLTHENQVFHPLRKCADLKPGAFSPWHIEEQE